MIEEEIEFDNRVDIEVENRILKWFAVAIVIKAVALTILWYFLIGEL